MILAQQPQNITLSPKQNNALYYLERDNNIEQLLYGGAAAGGKTLLGCIWQIERRIMYPGTAGCLARETLVDLRKTTLIKLYQVTRDYYPWFKYTYDGQLNMIKFENGSVILLIDLAWAPRDPDYNRLGGYELTDAFIDEAGEIKEIAMHKLFSRIRLMCPNGIPKLLMCSNPTVNWLKWTWVKSKAGKLIKLQPYQKYIRATVDDNPDKNYVENYKRTLSRLPIYDRKRLLYGDWDYTQNNDPFITAFNSDLHWGPTTIDRDYPLWQSYDFNFRPTTCTIFQNTHLGFMVHRVIQVVGGTKLLCQDTKQHRNHWGGIRVTGDVSGNQKRSQAAFTDLQVVEQELKLNFNHFVDTTGVNPFHDHSRRMCDYMMMHYPFRINNTEENTILMAEIQNGKVDLKGSLVKDRQENCMDALDTLRYGVNAVFPGGVDDIEHCLGSLIKV